MLDFIATWQVDGYAEWCMNASPNQQHYHQILRARPTYIHNTDTEYLPIRLTLIAATSHNQRVYIERIDRIFIGTNGFKTKERKLITKKHIKLLIQYNQWMNSKIYNACDALPDQIRKADLKANYKSIHSTLNYLLWADYAWLGRFTEGSELAKDYPKGPIGVDLYDDWAQLRKARENMDADFSAWAETVSQEWLSSDYSWHSVLTNKTITKPTWILVSHLLNHQTDHRGQVISLLKQQDVSVGDSDLLFMPTA